MLLFLKGFIIGIGKIIPGVSGSMLAIYFNIYEKALNAITNFFNDWKNNLKFIITLGIGIFLAIIFGSKVIFYLFNNYQFLTMMFFIGLIFGGTYDFAKEIKYTPKIITLIFFITIIFSSLIFIDISNNYEIQNNFIDNIVFFIAGIIDIFASIIPGISGTSLLMIMGIYKLLLEMTASIFNFSYVINNFNLYLSYGVGMFISFIFNTYLINYLLKKYHNTSYAVILGLAISSLILLLSITIKIPFTLIEFILGTMLLVIGVLISCILDK